MVARAPHSHLGWHGHPVPMGWHRGCGVGDKGQGMLGRLHLWANRLGTWCTGSGHAGWDGRKTSSAWEGHVHGRCASAWGDREHCRPARPCPAGQTPSPGAGGLPGGPSAAFCSCWALALFSRSWMGPRGAHWSQCQLPAMPGCVLAPLLAPCVPPGFWGWTGAGWAGQDGGPCQMRPWRGREVLLLQVSLTRWPQTGLPWGSRRVSLSPSQNFLFLLLFCIFNYDFLRRESLPGEHCL